MWGVTILLTGWLGAFVTQWGWFANPLLLLTLTLLLMGRYRGAFWVGVVTVLVGLSTLSWYLHSIPADEGGSHNRQLELLYPTLGYAFWMGSLLVGPASASILAKKEAEAKTAASHAPVAV
jgi:putative copper export protein